jgi:diguanylate cyclase (GGDEF)-like protein/PAS domain S-box-containing protein
MIIMDEKGRLPNSWILLAGFLILCLGVGYVVYFFQLPIAILFFLVIPIIFAAWAYNAWFPIVMLLALVSVAASVILNSNVDMPSQLLILLLATIGAASLVAVIQLFAKALKQSQYRYRIVADYTYYFELWKKPDGSFNYISPSCERITGYKPEEFIKNPNLFYEMIYPDDRHLVFARCAKSEKDLKPVEFRITCRNGQLRWLEHICREVYTEKGESLGVRSSNRDITEQKRAEEALAISTERLKLALEGTEDGVWDLNLFTGQLYVNPNYARTLGFPVDRTDHTLKDLHALIHPDDLQIAINSFKAHVKGETSTYKAEYRLRTWYGEWIWVLDRGKIIQVDESGKPTRMIGTHVNITERKQIEDALQQSEKKFRQLTENMREVFWLRDRNSGQFIYVSPSYLEVWGRSCDNLYEKPNTFMESIHPEDLGRFYIAQKELFETGKVMNEEHRIVRPDGSVRWVWSRAYPIYDNTDQYYRIAGVAEDVTERIETEAALKESEKKYRDLIEHQGEGVGIVDARDRIVYINPAGEEIFGVPGGMLTGRNMAEFLDKDQLALFQGQSGVSRQGIESSYEITIIRPDNDKRNLLLTATPRFDVNSQFLGTIVIFRDITQRKLAEDKLRYISLHDALTGLNNRAFFEDEINRLNQSNLYPVSLVMVDVDGLKQVNDNQGHSAGDELLVAVSDVLKRSLRSGDIVARIGGDEFAILMPNADSYVLEQVMNRINDHIGSENRKGDRQFNISLSYGGVTTHQKGSLKEAMLQADARMYEVKSQKTAQYFIQYPIIDPDKETQPPA